MLLKIQRVLRILRAKNSFLLPKRIKLIRQVAECHADDGDDDIRDSRPPVQYFYEEFQAEVIQKNIAHSDHQVPDNLCSAA